VRHWRGSLFVLKSAKVENPESRNRSRFYYIETVEKIITTQVDCFVIRSK